MSQTNLPKISIVSPNFNQGKFIEETIQSVLQQNYPNLEYIIIDGGSTDGSVEIIKKYEKYLAYWVSEPDSGQSEAIQKGLAKATGDVFNWLCSDDLLAEDALLNVGQAFLNPTVQVVSGDVQLFGDGFSTKLGKGTYIYSSLVETMVKSYNVQPVTYFKTTFIKQVKINPFLHYYMDREIWMKYILAYGTKGFQYIPKLLAHYRIHPQSKTFLEMDDAMLNPSSKFKIDLNTIFFSLAKSQNLKNEAEIIIKLTDYLIEDYCFLPLLPIKKGLIKQVLQFYLYQEAVKNFYAQNLDKARFIFQIVNYRHLPIRFWRDFFYVKRQLNKTA